MPLDNKDQLKKLQAEIADLKKQLKITEEKLKKSKKLGLVDDLTGCFNQNYYNKWVKDNFDPKRADGRLGVVFFDINNLKKINDKGGHEAGDQLLISFVNFLKDKLRKSDVIIRKGGDEFLVICQMPTKEEDYQSSLNNRLKKIMGSCLIGAAYGVAVYQADTDNNDIENTITRADQQMYNHKKKTKSPYIYHKVSKAYKKIFSK